MEQRTGWGGRRLSARGGQEGEIPGRNLWKSTICGHCPNSLLNILSNKKQKWEERGGYLGGSSRTIYLDGGGGR